MAKIIGFMGSGPADICMYTAYALQNTGRTVCVLDNSMDGILYGCIPTPDRNAVCVTFHNVDFMRLVPFVQWHELDYSYVLVQLGDRPQELCMASCSARVLVMDCERRNLDFYSRFMKESSMSMHVLLRGFCSGSISVRKIRERFAYENNLIDGWSFLPLHELDEAYRIGMQYENINRFSHISRYMEHVLMQVLGWLDAGSPAGIIQAVKNAKKGRMAAFLPETEKRKKIEYCILE